MAGVARPRRDKSLIEVTATDSAALIMTELLSVERIMRLKNAGIYTHFLGL
jgi:uncharacterized membrane protein YhiD involved in acid resistance